MVLIRYHIDFLFFCLNIKVMDAVDAVSDGRLSTSINVSMSDPISRSISEQNDQGKDLMNLLFRLTICLNKLLLI